MRAMNSVPHANTKSAPSTQIIAAGKPYSQYGDDGSIKANRRAATVVAVVPRAAKR